MINDEAEVADDDLVPNTKDTVKLSQREAAFVLFSKFTKEVRRENMFKIYF